MSQRRTLTCVELCAGAGGQALGLEQAGFSANALVEIDYDACQTLRLNRPSWEVIQADINTIDLRHHAGVDLLAAGLPCPPFSIAGRQLGDQDERNLFPAMFNVVEQTSPRAVLIENVRGFLSPKFSGFRSDVRSEFERLGYRVEWQLFNSQRFGVPQSRPRVAIVALRSEDFHMFRWPIESFSLPPSVGDTLIDLMAAGGWEGADSWAKEASGVGPALVGGSKKHGGPDLGPTRARQCWDALGVDGRGVVDHPPSKGFQGKPRLTVRMAARIQGFPDEWHFYGKRTSAYRQVGNAFPPPVARAISIQLAKVLTHMEPIREAI